MMNYIIFIVLIVLIIVICYFLINKHEKYSINKIHDNKDVYNLELNKLQLLNYKWKDVFDNFRLLRVKPTKLHVYTDNEKNNFTKTQDYPDMDSIKHTEQYSKSSIASDFDGGWMWVNGKWTLKNTENNIVMNSIRQDMELIFNNEVELRGYFYYPKGGYRIWHTNRNETPGWRLYLVGSVGDSYFCHVDRKNKQMVRTLDTNNSINVFKIENDEDNLLYHSVFSNDDRWSLGFLTDENAVITLLNSYISKDIIN